jgi:hypothetical protein
MIAGHFASALLVRPLFPRQRPSFLLACSMWVDIVALPLAGLGVEVIHGPKWFGFYPSSLEQTRFENPYTHALEWTTLPILLLAFLFPARWRAPLLAVALMAALHWALDLIVHEVHILGHSLTLGLWRTHFLLAVALEGGLCAVAIGLHRHWCRKTGRPSHTVAYSIAFIALILLLVAHR